MAIRAVSRFALIMDILLQRRQDGYKAGPTRAPGENLIVYE